MSKLGWTLAHDWLEPDLDRGLIQHKRLNQEEVDKLPEDVTSKVFKAADEYSEAADRAGIAVMLEEWELVGSEAQFIEKWQAGYKRY